jgi:hypothetical protein
LNDVRYPNGYDNRTAVSNDRPSPPTHGTESFPDEVPWEFLFRLAGRPSDSEFCEAESVEDELVVSLLRNLPDHRIASGYEIGRMLSARYGFQGHERWDRYYEAEEQGYFNEVGEVAILPEEMPESPEADATKW